MNLLTKTRKLNRLLQKAAGKTVSFLEMSEVLRDIIYANVHVINQFGQIIGKAILASEEEQGSFLSGEISHEAQFLLMKIGETISNTELHSEYIEPYTRVQSYFNHPYVTIVPITGDGQRLGTLVLSRKETEFSDDDYILAEYGSAVIGMEVLRKLGDETAREQRRKSAVQVAVGSLSYSELEAVEHIFKELQGVEGLLVASKIADRLGITRSVIVNALRKLESASVIETRSLGMKGTYIKILNEQLLPSLQKT